MMVSGKQMKLTLESELVHDVVMMMLNSSLLCRIVFKCAQPRLPGVLTSNIYPHKRLS